MFLTGAVLNSLIMSVLLKIEILILTKKQKQSTRSFFLGGGVKDEYIVQLTLTVRM